MAFEFASTNLVVELGIILALLMGWQFTLAEFVGGPIMIVLLVVQFRVFLKRRMVEAAQAQAEKGLAGSMEGHAAMDMSVSEGATIVRRALSPKGFTAIAHLFVMDWAAVWKDIVGGLLLAGALGTLVPNNFWRSFFLTDQPTLAAIWGPIVGPLVSVVSFVWMPGHRTPVHDHTVWGLVGVMRGAELCEEFSAALKKTGSHAVNPGDVDRVSPRIGDIHVVSNAGTETALSIHVYGANIGAVRRHRFDPATGEASEFISGYHNTTVPNLWDRSKGNDAA